jgi:hypothetical protein
MTLKRRIEALETHLFEDEKYKKYTNCIFELEVAVEGVGGGTFVRFPDGRREPIDRVLFDELTKNDIHFDVEIKE